MASPILISAEQVEELLNMKELLPVLENAFKNISRGPEGGVVQPVRQVLEVKPHQGFLMMMPAFSERDGSLAAKLITFFPNNTDVPSHQASVYHFDPTNGCLLAIIDGDSLTGIRTAVASAVATKYLAKPDSKILAILGAGVQAKSHYQAMSMLHDFEEVRIWNRTSPRAEKLAKEIGSTAKVCKTVKDAVDGADIICTVTSSTVPVLEKDWVKPGAHINAVGACRPQWQELAEDLVRSCVLYCDTREGCTKESGDVIISKAEIYAEIGEVLNGDKQAQPEKTTLFKSVGMALEDAVSAKMVYKKYKQTEKA